jgi:hypothetical protein
VQLTLTRALLALSAAMVSMGIYARPVVEHKLSASDEQQIDAISDKFFTQLKASKVESAVSGVFQSSELMAGKTAELSQISSQMQTSLNIYGPISECVLVQSSGRGNVVEAQQYICQHQKLATRWKIEFVKTTKGWITSNLSFDDKVMSED